VSHRAAGGSAGEARRGDPRRPHAAGGQVVAPRDAGEGCGPGVGVL